ncbi:hypothetical protein RSOLAG22IIIB_12962 [Rhizoctonia solani]|uniref:Uncharacterized protein n=1 Tax=Rhizoctonia solani TaxID=456999 RepID=A0A0K6GHC1_9AGAM|nr:hypothetical protein RSOLAG22IIIB_12962 [Rhizoctonia solani]
MERYHGNWLIRPLPLLGGIIEIVDGITDFLNAWLTKCFGRGSKARSQLTHFWPLDECLAHTQPLQLPRLLSSITAPQSAKPAPAGKATLDPPAAPASEGAAQDEQGMDLEASTLATCTPSTSALPPAPSVSPELISKRRA